MLTFSDWKNLTQTQQLEQISALLISCRYDESTQIIYRPVKMAPELFIEGNTNVLKNYPTNETTILVEKNNDYYQYQYLYYWITGACMKCYNHSLVWDIDNKMLLYYCRYCGEKTNVYALSEL